MTTPLLDERGAPVFPMADPMVVDDAAMFGPPGPSDDEGDDYTEDEALVGAQRPPP